MLRTKEGCRAVGAAAARVLSFTVLTMLCVSVRADDEQATERCANSLVFCGSGSSSSDGPLGPLFVFPPDPEGEPFAVPFPDPSGAVPSRLLVGGPASARDVAVLESWGYAATGNDEMVVLFEGGDAISEEYIAWLKWMFPGIVVEPDWFASTPEGSQSNAIVVGSEFGDEVDAQRAVRQVRSEPAHRIATGREVIVAVLDTGIDAGHPFLASAVLPGWDFVEEDADPSEERDRVDSDGDGRLDESYGHGTLVSGCVRLAAPGARILPVRVLDSDGVGSAYTVASGIRFARENGADVINLSLGMRRESQIVIDEIQAALADGVIVVASTGNDGRQRVDFPASIDGVVGVTAVGRRRGRARFGNGGGQDDVVAAPGRDVIGPYPGNTWARGTGTSFAAPFVSGAAALVRERYPRADVEEISARLRRGAHLRMTRALR